MHIWLAIKPAPTTPTLVTGSGQALVRCAHRALGALLDQVEGVQSRTQLIAHDQVGEGLVLCGESGGGIGGLGRSHQVQRANRCRCGSVQLRVESEPHGVDGLVPRLVSGDFGPGDRRLTRDDPRGPCQGLLDEVGRCEHGVGDPQIQDLLGLEHPVLGQRVRHDDLQRLLGADQVGQQPGASPAGDEAEEALRKGDRRCAGTDGAVVAVERQLQAPTHGGTIDQSERGHREVGEPPQDLVAQLGDTEGHFTRGDQRDAGQIRTDGEDEWLADDRQCVDVRRRSLVQSGVEFQQTLGPEGVGLRVIEAVVQGDQAEREITDGGLDRLELGMSHDLVAEQ